VGGLDSPNRIFSQLTKLVTLFISDCGPQVLNLNQPLAHEDLGHFGDACYPGVANELRIKSEQPIRFF